MNYYFQITTIFISALMLIMNNAFARDQIRIAGSSTVYPFATVVAETFGQNTSFPTPVIEATGTGGGFKLFCSGNGDDTTDFSNASRAIKQSEVNKCKDNGVEFLEIKIGFDGIVLANSVNSTQYSLTKDQIFLALAKMVPDGDKFIENPNNNWSDINVSLPDQPIVFYGPPPTSGTRDAFVEIVMHEGCKSFDAFKKAYPDKKNWKKACGLMREDGKFIEAGENDNLIVQKLDANIDALGIFGFSFLEENGELVQGAIVNDVEPTFESIADGSYPVSRPLYIYAKTTNIPTTKGIKEFIEELVSDDAIGEEGYLVEKGLIPLSEDELTELQEDTLAYR